MRAAARRLLDESDIYGKVNSLERPYEASADVIPTIWTPEHCGKRIVEAFETLSKLPPVRGPREFGTAWPPYEYTQADLNAQASLGDNEKGRRAAARNRTVVRATGVQIKQMDAVFDWLHDLRRHDEDLAWTVQHWGTLRSAGASVKEWCRDDGRSFQTFYRARDRGMRLIVDRLNAVPVPVF